MGVVYHANYLNWLEMGRTELIREVGFSYREMEERGVLLPVTDASVSYKRPARYDDVVEVRTWVEQLTSVRLVFGYEVYRVEDQELLVHGQTSHVFTNASLKPVRLDRQLPELYDRLQAERERYMRAAQR
ncbi:acyl-CoA thioesterase [Brevibacillus humidisoli]|uniref:acyl-CoA thioesterase n=1 Tax=Brevibacillus humidisoli TaxID=2895522 RepID=UPI001E3A2837|nr:acyl-CoA thioesterase [Brevibacillus humidisoli]